MRTVMTVSDLFKLHKYRPKLFASHTRTVKLQFKRMNARENQENSCLPQLSENNETCALSSLAIKSNLKLAQDDLQKGTPSGNCTI